MAVNIEDAGFEIRDMIAWVYGSGFPKSLNIGKAVDKLQGNERETVREYETHDIRNAGLMDRKPSLTVVETKGTSEWEGWGTSLKPALEPITVARKPIEKGLSVAENCLKWGTGGINIDGGRVEIPDGDDSGWSGSYAVPPAGSATNAFGVHKFDKVVRDKPPIGRWPANFIHDGSQEVLELFPMTKSGSIKAGRPNGTSFSIGGELGKRISKYDTQGDSGSAARFFYCAKASKQDRDEGCEEIVAKTWKDQGFRDNETTHLSPRAGAGRTSLLRNNHPTVKPTSLMRYLCRLVTPPGGTILDPFMGSGSTGKAAALEGFRFIGIELEKEYTAIAEKRIMSAQPLFAGVNT
jgi:site-specific DNA-methyltransferase (adenine-specific)